MTYGKRAQKFHTYDASRHYPDRGSACDWLKLCVAQWYCIWTSQQTPGGRTHISFFPRRLRHSQSDKIPFPCFRNYAQTYLLDMERLYGFGIK